MKPPAFTCNQCSKLMCESCKDDHNDMFEGHAVFEMCQKHEESITHLCTKCVIPLCMKCAVLDHKAHNTLIYKPDVDQLEIDRILVVDKSTMLVLGYFCGCIYKYNTVTNKTEVIVEGLDKFGYKYMSVMYTSLGPRFILSESGAHRITIYDRNWKPLKTMKGQLGSGEGEFIFPLWLLPSLKMDCLWLILETSESAITAWKDNY